MNNKDTAIEQLVQAAKLIESAAEKLKAEEIENTRTEQQETEPDIQRVPFCKPYYTIEVSSYGAAFANQEQEQDSIVDNQRFKHNNYFADEKTARSLADKINFLMELQRYHDIYCPDFEPDWNDPCEKKYVVVFDITENKYMMSYYYTKEIKGMVHFPSNEIAEKVCDRLNIKYGYVD